MKKLKFWEYFENSVQNCCGCMTAGDKFRICRNFITFSSKVNEQEKKYFAKFEYHLATPLKETFYSK